MTTKYQIVANNLNCNGINIVDFAEMAGNIQIANKLKSYRIENVEIRDIAAIYNGNVAISDSYWANKYFDSELDVLLGIKAFKIKLRTMPTLYFTSITKNQASKLSVNEIPTCANLAWNNFNFF